MERDMDKRLYEVLRTGNLTSLLLEENQLILDRFLSEFVSQTPLHFAILSGDVNFAKEILRRKPQLAHVLSSQGFSPLHMASANGSADIVKELLPIIVDVSHDRDRKGWTPVHAAAMKGHVNVLEAFTRLKWIRDMTDRDETVLHLCVKYNQLDALKMLIGLVGDDNEFVNRKDENGNTILHLAAMKNDIPMMEFLSAKSRVEINTMNVNGLTALDVWAPCPSISGDMKMAEILQRKGAKRAREMSTQQAPSTAQQRNLAEMGMKSIDELRSMIMVVGVLTLTLSFQACLTPPGGLWQDDVIVDINDPLHGKNHTAGTSIWADKDPHLFYTFNFFNTTVFVASLSLILMSTRLGNYLPTVSDAVKKYLTLALFSMAMAFCLCNVATVRKGIFEIPRWGRVLLSLAFLLIIFAVVGMLPSAMRWMTKQHPARARGSNDGLET